jgi:hypothetical protein
VLLLQQQIKLLNSVIFHFLLSTAPPGAVPTDVKVVADTALV